MNPPSHYTSRACDSDLGSVRVHCSMSQTVEEIRRRLEEHQESLKELKTATDKISVKLDLMLTHQDEKLRDIAKSVEELETVVLVGNGEPALKHTVKWLKDKSAKSSRNRFELILASIGWLVAMGAVVYQAHASPQRESAGPGTAVGAAMGK